MLISFYFFGQSHPNLIAENNRAAVWIEAAIFATIGLGVMALALADAIEALRAEGEDAPDELITRLSPIAWEPVNFLGQFTFDAGNARPLEDRRPLRSGADEVDEEASRDFRS